jgi:hypothetical protein
VFVDQNLEKNHCFNVLDNKQVGTSLKSDNGLDYLKKVFEKDLTTQGLYLSSNFCNIVKYFEDR